MADGVGVVSGLALAGVLLDMDGLLLDTERVQRETGPAVLARFGYTVAAGFFDDLVGVDRVEAARRINLALGADIDAVQLDQAWNAAMDARMADAIPLRPGVARLLDALDARNLPRAVATNSLTARAEWKLEHAGLRRRFGPVVGVDRVARGKPAPDVYLKAAELIGAPPALCAALDDSELGVKAALAAGVGLVIQVPDLTPGQNGAAHHLSASLDEARARLGL